MYGNLLRVDVKCSHHTYTPKDYYASNTYVSLMMEWKSFHSVYIYQNITLYMETDLIFTCQLYFNQVGGGVENEA
jgi:hypothetical protein